MTKNDFNKIIENGYAKAISKFSDPQYVKEFLSKHADNDNKISTESLIISSILMSAEITREMLSVALQDILEIDD